MQDNALSKWVSPLMAFCLSFIIIATLAPMTGIQIDRQLDFWLLWLATMVLLALPICYLEVALAKRSKQTALQALSALTRDADASPRWRIVGWLAVIFMPFLVGGMLANASGLVMQYTLAEVNPQWIFLGLAVVSIILSLLPRLILIGITAVTVLLAIVLANVLGVQLPEWQVTPIEFSEWGSATILALVASGLGLGVYSQNSLTALKQQDVATKTALPIWTAQLLAVIAFGFFAVQAQLPAVVLAIAVAVAAALLLQLAREQLSERQIALPIQWLILIAAIAVWAVAPLFVFFDTVLMVWGLIICLIYTIFAGWIMKISHLRKSLNFGSEALYNLWRIAVRVISPLAIILALIAVIGRLFA